MPKPASVPESTTSPNNKGLGGGFVRFLLCGVVDFGAFGEGACGVDGCENEGWALEGSNCLNRSLIMPGFAEAEPFVAGDALVEFDGDLNVVRGSVAGCDAGDDFDDEPFTREATFLGAIDP
jgi:hypothetical protein